MHPGQFERMREASGGAEGFGPLLVSLDNTFRALGIGRTKGFELIRDGHLTAKNGRGGAGCPTGWRRWRRRAEGERNS